MVGMLMTMKRALKDTKISYGQQILSLGPMIFLTRRVSFKTGFHLRLVAGIDHLKDRICVKAKQAIEQLTEFPRRVLFGLMHFHGNLCTKKTVGRFSPAHITI